MGGGSVVEDWVLTPTANKTLNLVLVGRTGNGKSATGNSILGRKVFVSRPSSAGVTSVCCLQTTMIGDGTCINVIDTPGLFDFSDGGSETIGKEIVRCLELARDGIHAVLVVFSIRTRFSKEEEATLCSLKALFGNRIIDYMIIIFTGGDELEEMELTLDAYLGRDCPAPLREIIRLCGDRYVLFDNKTGDVGKKAAQFHHLYTHLKVIMTQNGGHPYTDKLLAELRDANKLREQAIEAVVLIDNSEQKVDEMKQQLQKTYEEQLKKMTKMIESKLTTTTKMLEKQLAEEKKARAKAEEKALKAQKKSNEEMSRLKASLQLAEEKKARAKAEEKVLKAQKKSNEEMSRLKASLENARREAAAALFNVPPPPPPGCAIL